MTEVRLATRRAPRMKQPLRKLGAGLAFACAVAAAGLAHGAEKAKAPAKDERQFSCPGLEASTLASDEYGEMTQGRHGWFFRTAADLTWRYYVAPEAENYVRRLADALDRKGARIGFVIVPPRGVLYNDEVIAGGGFTPILTADEGGELYQRMLKSLRRAGAIAPDIRAAARAAESQFFFKRDHHWTPDGARISAKAFADAYRQEVGEKSLGALKFKTEPAADLELKGGMAQAISRACRDSIPAEPFTLYETRQQASDAADLGLFGDAPNSVNVVLLGSSFSDVASFNFDGFLSEAMGSAVANHAISGGLLMKSAVSYFSSAAFQADPPDLIVWEAPVYYDISGSALDFRQIIPAVGGACAPDAAVASVDGRVSGAPAAMDVPTEAKVSGTKNFLYFEASNPAFTTFSLRVEYDDGDLEEAPIDRSDRYINEGRFFFEFSPDIRASVSRVTLVPADERETDYTMRICRTQAAEERG